MNDIPRSLVSLLVVIIAVTLITVAPVSTYAQITEDDGYTYPEDATEEEKEEIDEQEREAWEDAGRPGEDNSNNDDDDDDNNDDQQVAPPIEEVAPYSYWDGTPTFDGSDCPSRPAVPREDQPYCDEAEPSYSGSCWDRKDYSDTTGLYSCKNGEDVKDWRDCLDSEENKKKNKD